MHVVCEIKGTGCESEALFSWRPYTCTYNDEAYKIEVKRGSVSVCEMTIGETEGTEAKDVGFTKVHQRPVIRFRRLDKMVVIVIGELYFSDLSFFSFYTQLG
jgi:hypothetical protein